MERIDFMDKHQVMQAINEASDYITKHIADTPDIAIVLGSGLGSFVQQIENPTIIEFKDIPHFQKPTVVGHGSKMYYGLVGSKKVLVLQGRYHLYEGYSIQQVTLPIRVLANLKIPSLILTNACGGVSKHLKPADLMIIEDHLALFCPNPLHGAHLDAFGERFVDMSAPYDLDYIELATQCAKDLSINIKKGVYGFWQGPTYESPAEVRAYRTLGADVVGMSTVPENIVARSANMRVLGISCVTNMTCIHTKTKTDHAHVVEMSKIVEHDFITLLNSIIEKM